MTMSEPQNPGAQQGGLTGPATEEQSTHDEHEHDDMSGLQDMTKEEEEKGGEDDDDYEEASNTGKPFIQPFIS
jgi:hypothetical protein